ncbi:hypothetical protein, partial [Xenorhabdus bovienii]|uniref:hypothetical protein n=1 Tax=Xenorhabdus bovienii TaxID=40576 RepID=UPI003DA42518
MNNGASGAFYSVKKNSFTKIWPAQLRKKGLDEIYWYRTHSNKFSFFPRYFSHSITDDYISLTIEKLACSNSLIDIL